MVSTVVLARKYRPRRFEDMVGQDTAVRALSNALAQRRLHHAYLFTGTRGIGKTTVSRIFAKCLNCTGADGQGDITATPCGTCDACTQIDEDRFVDYLELDAASNRGIAEVRDLLERAAYKPSVGRFKVFMIDEAHQLTKDSFNALLKTLEEPPEYLKFVLATTDPQKMLPTVLSRCLQFNLRPMAPSTIREYLAGVLEREGIGFDAGSLDILSRAARGSMRDALSLTDQAIAYGGGALAADAVRAMLGAVGIEPVFALLGALARRDARAVVDGVDAMREQGASPDGALETMAVALQDIAIEQAVPGSIEASRPGAEELKRLAASTAPDDTQLLYSIVLHGRRELELAPDPHAGMTMVLLRMLAFPAAGPVPVGASAPPDRSDSRRDGPRVDALAGPARDSQGAVAKPSVPVPAPATPPTSIARADDGPRAPLPVDASSSRPQPLVTDAARAFASARVAQPQPSIDARDAPCASDAALADRWAGIVGSMQAQQLVAAMVRELAVQSALVSIEDAAAPQRWRLVVERDSLRQQALQDKLAGALAKHIGHPVQLDVALGRAVDTPAQREAAERERRARLAERIVLDDPLVRDMLTQFPTARIVPGSIRYTQELEP